MNLFLVFGTACALGLVTPTGTLPVAPDVATSFHTTTATREDYVSRAFAAPHAGTCIPADQCCKICSKGKACGDTCISRSYVCHKGRGCACNADDVCE